MTLSGRWYPRVAARRGAPPVCLVLLAAVSVLLGVIEPAWAQRPLIAEKPLQCHAGYTYHQGHNLCLRCRQGTYKNTTGPEACSYCPKDSNGRNGTTRGDGAINKEDCYFRPYMQSFWPHYGPVAGGTAVNITMGYLKSNHTLVRARFNSLVTQNCTRHSSSFVCYTPSTTTLDSGRISIEMMDERSEYVAHSSADYSFLPNPNITSIDNLNTFLSGGILLTIRGEHLTSVASPEMVVSRIYMKNSTRRFYSDCSHTNSTQMVCPTPDLNEELYDHTQDVNARIKRNANGEHHGHDKPLNSDDREYFVSFKMDGVANLDKISEISVFKDPVYNKFGESHFLKFYRSSKEEQLYIAGKRLDHIVTVNDIDVVVGDGACIVTSLVSNLLVCLPPLKAPDYGAAGPGPDNSHYVQVLVGSLRFHVGYLKYVDEQKAALEILVGMSLVSICLLCIIILFAVVLWLQRRHHNHWKGTSKLPDVESKLPLPVSTRSSASSGEEYLFTGNGSSNNSEGTATTGVPSLEVDVETAQMMHIDIWSALEEPLKSKVKECQINSQRLTLGDCIGVGSFGRVFKGEMDAEDGSNKIPVAVKTLRDGFTSASELPQFLEEGLIMAGFKHDHILPLYGVAVSECLPFVVSEYMDCGDLRAYIKSDESISVEVCLDLARQVAEGMVYLSGKGFIHRDLAARNCLINSTGVVKIGDFGLSRDLHGSDYYRVGDMGRPLPVKWMSIESLNLGKFSTKSDVWSFGIVLWELLTRGQTPYPSVENIDLKDYLNANNRLAKPSEASDPVYEIMIRCWRTDPVERPKFEQLVMYLGDVRTLDYIPPMPEPTEDNSHDTSKSTCEIPNSIIIIEKSYDVTEANSEVKELSTGIDNITTDETLIVPIVQ